MASGPAVLTRRLYDEGTYSDVLIKCGGQEFKAHKVVICLQSEFFRNALKEQAFKEGQTGIVELHETTPAAVQAMLQYFYVDVYSQTAPKGQGAMIFHLDLYDLAKFVSHKELKNQVQACFIASVAYHCKDDVAAFSEVIQKVYEVTGDEESAGAVNPLRECVVRNALKWPTQFFDNEGPLTLLLESLPAFTKDTATMMRSTLAGGDQRVDPNCSRDLHCSQCGMPISVSPTLKAKNKKLTCPYTCYRSDYYSERHELCKGFAKRVVYVCSHDRRHRFETADSVKNSEIDVRCIVCGDASARKESGGR